MLIHRFTQYALRIVVTLVQDLSIAGDYGSEWAAAELLGRLVQVRIELMQYRCSLCVK